MLVPGEGFLSPGLIMTVFPPTFEQLEGVCFLLLIKYLLIHINNFTPEVNHVFCRCICVEGKQSIEFVIISNDKL